MFLLKISRYRRGLIVNPTPPAPDPHAHYLPPPHLPTHPPLATPRNHACAYNTVDRCALVTIPWGNSSIHTTRVLHHAAPHAAPRLLTTSRLIADGRLGAELSLALRCITVRAAGIHARVRCVLLRNRVCFQNIHLGTKRAGNSLGTAVQ